MTSVTLDELATDLPRFLRMAEEEDIVILRDGRPAGLLVGVEAGEIENDAALEDDARFLTRIAAARSSLAAGRGVRLEGLAAEFD